MEYKVGHYAMDYMQMQMNEQANDGWRVISVVAKQDSANTAYVTYERQKPQGGYERL